MSKLPGVETHTYSLPIQNSTDGPSTQKLLLIGTAVDGPINKPTRVTSGIEFQRLYGPASYSQGYKNPVTGLEDGADNGGTLAKEVKQALMAGAQDVWVCRASGTYASNTTAFDSKMSIRATYPGRIYNEVTISSVLASGSGSVTITVAGPAIKGGVVTLTPFTSGQTIADVINELNNNSSTFNMITVKPNAFPTALASAATSLGTTTVALSGTTAGTNGTDARGEDYFLSKNNYAAALAVTPDINTFDVLLGDRFEFDVCALSGIYADDQISDTNPGNYSILVEYAKWLDQMSTEVRACRGYISARPTGIIEPSEYMTYITDCLQNQTPGVFNAGLRWIRLGPFLTDGVLGRSDPQTNNVNIGSRVSLTVGDVIVAHNDLGRYTSGFSAICAALSSRTPLDTSLINQPLPGVIGYTTIFPGKYAKILQDGVGASPTNELAGGGAYVVLMRDRVNPDGPLVIANDVTLAPRDDIFRNEREIRVVNTIHTQMSKLLSPFIGKTVTPGTRANMDRIVNQILEGHAQAGHLVGGRGTGYIYTIDTRSGDMASGTIRVNFELVLSPTLRRVIQTATVRSQ